MFSDGRLICVAGILCSLILVSSFSNVDLPTLPGDLVDYSRSLGSGSFTLDSSEHRAEEDLDVELPADPAYPLTDACHIWDGE